MQKIPLEERLWPAGISGNRWPDAVWLYMNDYCRNLSEMSSGQSYMAFYEDAVMDETYGDIENTFVAQAAYEAASDIYPPETASELLYQILIKPFCDGNIWKPKGGNTK